MDKYDLTGKVRILQIAQIKSDIKIFREFLREHTFNENRIKELIGQANQKIKDIKETKNGQKALDSI